MQNASPRTADDSKYLLHSDQTWVKAVMFFHTIETYTLAQGFTQEHRQALQGAVTQVVKANPILMGQVTLEKGCLYLTPNAFSLENHVFFEEMDVSDQVPSSFQFTDENHNDNIQFMTDSIVPLVKHQRGTGRSEVKNKSPLFSFTLFALTESIICYKMSLSHLIGDGSTYYALMDQVNSALNKEPIEPIHWDNPLAKTCGVLPDQCSERDRSRRTGLPILMCLLRNLPSVPFRKRKCFFFDQKAIDEKKLSLVNRKQHDFLSTNDIIMSALCRMNRTAKLFSMAINRRGRTRGVTDRDGGIFIVCPLFDPEAGKDPNVIRQVVKRGAYFEPDQLPLRPYLQGEMCGVTNWASLTTFLNVRGVKTLCHMPCPASVGVLTDGCIIFKVKDDCTAVCCNFPVHNVEDDLFLKDIIHHEGGNGKVWLNEAVDNDDKSSWSSFHPNKSSIALTSALLAVGAVVVQSALRSSRK